MPLPAPFVLALLAAQAQPAAPPQRQVGPPPEFITAAQAFGNCVKQGSIALPGGVTPEAGAQQVLANCAAQRTALDTRFDAWVAGPNFPEAGRAMAREQYKAQMSMIPAQIADRIRKGRAAPAPTPSPAPTATPSPTPR